MRKRGHAGFQAGSRDVRGRGRDEEGLAKKVWELLWEVRPRTLSTREIRERVGGSAMGVKMAIDTVTGWGPVYEEVGEKGEIRYGVL